MSRIVLAVVLFFQLSVSIAQIKLETGGPKFVNDRVVVEVNDAGEMVTLSKKEYLEMTGRQYMKHLVGFFNYKMSWQTVASYITSTMEAEFDVYIFINVDYEGRQNMADPIPAQYMKVIERTQADQKLFVREKGQVVGIRSDVAGNNGEPAFATTIEALDGTKINGHGIMRDLIPVSSGASHKAADPQPYVDTPTGIYRINHSKSDVKRYGTGMWHSLYFDLIYPWGKWSGLAVHGTSTNKYSLLGKHQDSHGCVRVKKPVANLMYENLINDGSYWADDLPNLNNKMRLKSENGETKPGVRALIILFYGYDSSMEQWDT